MDKIKEEINWNSYLIPGTDVLINKLGAMTNEELSEKERKIVREKLILLYLRPIKGNFDISHLLSVHKYIFDDIYPFAGKLRTCTLQKDIHMFCNPEDIEKQLTETLKQMNEEFDKDIYSKESFAFKLAPFYNDLLYIHPFREGNGRTIRSFLRDFVVEKSKNKTCGEFDLDYTKIDKEKLLLGTAFRYIYPSYLEMEFINGLVPVEKEKNSHNSK